MGRVVLLVTGVLWVAFGVIAWVAPGLVVGGLGIDLATSDASTDVRATYGGAQIGIGLFLLYCSRAEARVRAGLIALGLIAGGFGLARISGMLVDGARGGLTWMALTIEVAVVALAWLAARRDAAPRPAGT